MIIATISNYGIVVAILVRHGLSKRGQLAGRYDRRADVCKVGDWVVFARYAGSRIEIEGGEVRLLNDDEVLATVQDPTDILHKY